jgi:c(7)-type cytochrome triheme protein
MEEERMNKILAAMAFIAVTGVGIALATVGGGDITLKNRGGDTLFSHEKHVSGMGLACTECHDKLYTNAKQHKKTTMKQMQKGKSCGACHDGKKAFSVKGHCATCHKK